MHKRKSRGPKTDPYGTPKLISRGQTRFHSVCKKGFNPFKTDKTTAKGNLGQCLIRKPQAKCH